MTRLDNLSENEIKESDKDILREIIEVLRFYIQQIDP
jgi:predicted DNA-binding protein